MLAELKRLHSPDVSDLPGWRPKTDDWAILVQILAAPQGSPGEESFDMTVCSPTWLARRVQDEHIVDGRHHLVIAEYDYGQLLDYISKYVASCEGTTWQDVATKLGRLGRWEFEDYRP
jgi:hypothetical protein